MEIFGSRCTSGRRSVWLSVVKRRSILLVCCSKRYVGETSDEGKVNIELPKHKMTAPTHLWLRAETKLNEKRSALTPAISKELLNAGSKALLSVLLFLMMNFRRIPNYC